MDKVNPPAAAVRPNNKDEEQNPVLSDMLVPHEELDRVRAAVATALHQADPNTRAPMVMAFSIVSCGVNPEDQIIVYTPGGEGRNTREARKRLLACLMELTATLKAQDK